MKKTFFRGIAAAILIFMGCASMQASTALCPFGQMSHQPWQAKYYRQWYNNNNPSGWYASDFDDSTWETISGPLSTANGLPYYATDWGENYYKYYLRRHFNVSSLDQEIYTLYVTHDDDCVVYLNGVQIYNNGDCLTAPNYQTVYVPKELLRTGDNLLAVMVRDSGGGEAFADFGIYDDELPWISVELASPGTLGQEVLYQVEMLSDVEFIRVKGAVNGDDWTTLKNMANLRGADLSQATATEVPNEQFRDRKDLQYFLLPQGLKTIGDHAFRNTRVGGFQIPATVTTIGQSAFSNNAHLTTVDIPANSILTSIGEYAFYDCQLLTGIALPSGITELKEGVFQNCYALASVVLPPALESIGRYCFDETYALKNIDFPQTLNRIGYYAFYKSGLENVVLPQNLSALGESAFSGCKSLRNVELPATPNITYLNSDDYNRGTGYLYTFSYCTALEKVTCLSATPPSVYNGYNPFYGVDRSQVTLVVPAFSIVDYKLDTYWHNFGTIVEGAEPSFLNIGSTLTLTNNRRPSNKVDVLLNNGARLIVGGNAPFEVGMLTIWGNPVDKYFGQLQNNTPAMTTDQVRSRFYAYSDRWYFITPLHDVNIADVSHNNGEASFVFRYYDGQNRATNGPQGSWKDLTDNTLKAGQGYIFRTNRNGQVTLPATATGKDAILAYDDATTALNTYTAANAANANWNFVGNPYPCHYDTYYMDLAAPITVWDYSNRTYRAYSPFDDGYVLHPMEAFFVQKPNTQSQILFAKEGRLFSDEVDRANVRSNEVGDRQLFDIVVTDGTLSDHTRLVVNPQASAAYETERDATKFFSSETAAPQLYTIDDEGNQLAINERPLTDGTVALGFNASQPGTFTISLSRGHGSLLLSDALTGKTVDLAQESYTFTISENTATTTRFLLSVASEITQVTTVGTSAKDGNAVHDLQGRRLNVERLPKGLYLKDGKKYMVK